MQPSIIAEDVSYQYKGGNWGIKDFSFQALPEDFYLVTGASGSGKSTLVRCLSGIIPHLYQGLLKGRIQINGLCPAENPLWKITEQMGVVLQNPLAQFLTDTVKKEVLFSLGRIPLDSKEVDSRFDEVVEFFQLHTLLSRDPRTLSGGEQQRVILACHLARQPQIFVLDEPLSMLDRHIAAKLVQKMQSLANKGRTVIIFEHRKALFKTQCKLLAFKSKNAGPPRELPDLSFLKPPPSFTITIENLEVSIKEEEILKDISLSFSNGEIIAIIGPNGAGKTTFFRTLAGFQSYRGRILVKETPLKEIPLDMGMVFQNPDVQLFNPTIKEELLYGLPAIEREVYQELIAFLELDKYASSSPLLLSEGEKKRLSLGIALLRQPRHGFMLDEPTFGQDEVIKNFCGEMLRSLAQKGYACLVATHDMEWAKAYASRFVVIRKGILVYNGSQWEHECS